MINRDEEVEEDGGNHRAFGYSDLDLNSVRMLGLTERVDLLMIESRMRRWCCGLLSGKH